MPGCGLILRIALGRDPGSSHLPKQVRHVGPGLWTPALRADTTSSIAWALSMFPSAAGNGCPKQVFGLPVTIHHWRTSEEMDSDQHICQDGFLSPARNLAIKLWSCLQTMPCSWNVFQRLADLAGRMGSHIWIEVFTFFFYKFSRVLVTEEEGREAN